MRLSLQAGLLVLALTAPSAAQDNSATTKIPKATLPDCAELFESAEQAFRSRKVRGSEMLARAERQLIEFVRLCNETPASFQASDQLRIVHEELAEHNLLIASFYLNRFYCGKGGKAGAKSRLKHIIERYPKYSHLDRVLFLLGKLSMSEDNLDEAAAYFQGLIRVYPGSQYAGEAVIDLSAIEVRKSEKGSPSP